MKGIEGEVCAECGADLEECDVYDWEDEPHCSHCYATKSHEWSVEDHLMKEAAFAAYRRR